MSNPKYIRAQEILMEDKHTELASIKPGGSLKFFLLFSTLVLCAAFAEVSTGLLAPAMPILGSLYEKTPSTVQLTIVSFAIMFAVGQLFFGPFSDRSGRRKALLIGAVLTLIGSVCAGLADSIWGIVLSRAIQGLGAASGYVVSRAIIRDIYGAKGAPKAMALMFTMMSASFLAAPLVGGVLLDFGGWRVGFILASIAAAIWLASSIFIFPETRVVAPGSRVQSIYSVYLGLFRDRAFLSYLITHSIAYGGVYCFVAGAPYLFIEGHAFKPASYGMIAAAVMSGFLIGSLTARHTSPRWEMNRAILISLVTMICASVISVALECLGLLPVFILVTVEFVYWFGTGFLAPNTAAGVMISHPHATGAAAAALGFVQMCCAGTVAFVQGLIYDGTAFPMVGGQMVLSLTALAAWRYLSRK
jgi:DHA1 family bicyclomycin/chloramphenicol resistance-like MFS transporter